MVSMGEEEIGDSDGDEDIRDVSIVGTIVTSCGDGSFGIVASLRNISRSITGCSVG